MKINSFADYQWKNILSGIFVLFLLYLTSLYNYLLFHSLAEIFSIIVACGIFMIAWNSKIYINNNYIIFIGIAYLFIAGLDLIHTLAYKDMGVFQGYGANLPTQLWIAARYVESLTLLMAPLFMTRKLKPNQLFSSYLFLIIILLASIFYWNVFPDCFVDGVGLTLFKKGSEYIISLILLGSLYLLFKKRYDFEPSIFRLLCISIILTICAELAFTFYINVYGFSNLVGHIFKIISFYLIYKATIYTGLKEPCDLMFQEISEKEKRYRQMFETNDAVKLIINSADGSIVEANNAACHFYGYSKNKITSLNITDINALPPDKVIEAMKKTESMKKLFVNIPHRLASGEIRDVEVYSGPIEYGQNTFIHSIIHDITSRKQAEEKLRKSEEKFRLAFRTSPDAINLNSVEDGVYLDINKGFTKIMGYTREEVIGRASAKLNIWNNIKDRERLISGLRKHGLVENMEADFIAKDGQIKTGLMSARILSIENQNTILSITRDITEKKRAEKKLRENEKRYRQLVENIAELVWEVDTEGVYTYISPRALDVYGLKPEKIIGKMPFDLMPAEEAKRVADIFGKIKDARAPFWKLENIVQHIDGRQIYMETTGFPFFDNEGNLLGYRGTDIDITERKQNERDTQTLVESTVGMIGQELFDIIVVKLCAWLDCDCAIIGKITDDDTVKAVSMLLDGEFVSNYSYNLKGSPCAETARKGYCAYSENVCALFPDDPDLIEMDADGYVGASLENKKGKAIGILCGISRGKSHITKHTKNIMKIIGARISAEIERIQVEKEKKKLESKLQQAQKMEAIGTLAGGIAHDFNNILFPIIGHAEMLLEDIPEDSPFRESLHEIYTSGIRAKALVKQILTFARQGSNELKLIKIQHILKEALELLRSSIPATIDIKQDLNIDCGVIKADSTQIHQIIMNLATNAYHAMEDTGGELKVSLNEVELGEYDLITPDMTPGVYACLTVADTGVGMDKDLTKKIFDPFFTTKKEGKGTGMGLAVVHGIVNSMGGAIHVYSEPGKGTEFHTYLPVVQSPSETQKLLAGESIQKGTERILLIDDEDAIVTMEEQMLKRLGYQVTSHTSSIEALEAFREASDKFDLVITDMAMPNISGDKLSAEMLKIRPDIPILLCTGFVEQTTQEKAASMGIKNFLMKPITIKELSKSIRKTLDKKNAVEAK